MAGFWRKWCGVLALVAASLSFQASAATVDMHDPYKMLITVATDTFNEIKANADKVKSDVAYRRDLIKRHLMPYVDSTYAAYKVIGNNLKQTTKEERAAFADAFSIEEHRSFGIEFDPEITKYQYRHCRYTDYKPHD